MIPIGQHLHWGKYIIEQELGRGGFGITYKAINIALNQVVVIKTLNDALRQDPNFLNHQHQFQAEARRLAKCIHPSIVRVNDFFVEDGLPFIVMDYVPGPTLDTVVLPDRPLSEEIALYYIRQVGDAVKTIHHNGLLHRDIKPQNLILREGSQQIVLIDFGIAREFTPGLMQTHTHIVSEGYAPIEQYLPQAQRSPATDIYGLAATLYTLLTGQVPIAAPLRDRCPLTELRQLQPGVSASVNEAVMRGMAMEPSHRPATVEAWLSLLPDARSPKVAQVISPVSQVATVAVAPIYRKPHPLQAQARTMAVGTPAPVHSPRRQLWLPGLVAVGTLVPLIVGYSVWRSLTSSSDPSTSTDQPTPTNLSTPSGLSDPTPSPAREATQPLEELPPSDESQPLEEPSPPSDSSPLPEATSEDAEAIAEPSVPSTEDASAGEGADTNAGGNADVIPNPAAQPIEPAPPELQQRNEEAREAQQRQEERAREEQQRQEEQAREAQQRAEERAREAEQNNDEGQGGNNNEGQN